MKELTIRIQKSDISGYPDTNHIICNGANLGSIAGTLERGKSEFDINHGIVYFHNNDVFCGLLWNVTKIEVCETAEVKA